MPDPYDYTSAFANLPAPGAALLQGIQGGAALTQLQAQAQQQRAALAQQQQKQQYIQSLINNPDATGADYAKGTLIAPELHSQFKQAWDMKSADQQQNQLKQMVEWSSAIQNGQPKIASDAMRAQADAIENTHGGQTPESKALRAKADQVDANPQAANFILKSAIAANPNGPKAIDAIVAQNKDQREQDAAPADLAKKQADAGTAQADLTEKNLGIVGQTLGALQGKGAKPAQAQTALNSLAARGVISKDELPSYLAAVPTDPNQLDDWLGSMKLAGMKPSDQMKYTAPTADAKLQSDTSIKTTGMNNATQIKVQDKINERQDSKGDAEPTLDADTLTAMAQQYLAGDKSVMQNLGRGAQGSANIVALRQEITKQAKAQGMSGSQIAATMADYVGTLAGQRTAGTRIANVEMASDEAQRLIPLAKQASADVARSGFLPFGRAQNMFDDQTNDPALRKFAAANNALVNVYSRAISPGGVATVSDKEHARHMLSTAMDHKSYLAVLDQMQREIQAAREAPQAVRGAFRDRVTGGAAPAPAAPALPTGWSVEVH